VFEILFGQFVLVRMTNLSKCWHKHTHTHTHTLTTKWIDFNFPIQRYWWWRRMWLSSFSLSLSNFQLIVSVCRNVFIFLFQQMFCLLKMGNV
jgi:hypothetical protein